MSTSDKSSAGLAGSAATVSFAVMCSRLLGLIREQVFAGLFGAGYAYDAFVVAFRIPNLLRDLFGEGALSAAFVSVFSDYDANRSREQTWLLASNVLCFFLVAVSAITLLGMLFANQIVAILAPRFGAITGKAELTAAMTVIMMPFLLFISLAAVVMGILNTKGRFFIPSLASSFFNLGSIIGGTSLAFILPRFGHPAIVGMAFGTLIGGFLQLAVQLPVLRQVGFRFTPSLNISDPGLKRVLKLMVPATIGLSATQINIFINTNFASSCAEGSVSWLNYAFRLVQLPIGLFGVAISIAALPLLARQASTNNLGDMRETFVSSLTMVFCLTIPATAGLLVLSVPIIRVIFEHGAFTAADTSATAVALSLYGIGLFAYSANKVIVPVYYAINATRYPVIASFLAIGFNVLIIVNTIDHFQHRAIALSTSAVMILNFLFLVVVLYRKIGGFSIAQLFSGLIRILGATAVMTVLLLIFYRLLAEQFQQTIVHQLSALLVLIGAAAAVYLVVLNFLGLQELREISGKIKNRLSGS
ncbi:MAG: murein biosynthesis integral membrane protein MurJ [Desulfofustis sp.]